MAGQFPFGQVPWTGHRNFDARGLEEAQSRLQGYYNHIYPPQAQISNLSNQHLRRPLLEVVAALPETKRRDMTYVVCHLQRNSLFEPWGIAFSMFDDRIVLGNIRESSRHIIQWCHCIHACDNKNVLDSRVVFGPMMAPTGATRGLYPQVMQHHASALATPNTIHQQLWSGDLILSIDGFDSGYFQNLTGFTNYIRTVQQCTLVVLRHSEATAVAMAQWDPKIYGGLPPPPDTAYRSAFAAETAWKQILSTSIEHPPIAVRNFQSRDALSHVVRQVTPDRPVGERPHQSETPVTGPPRSLLFAPLATTTGGNALDLLSQVAASSVASITSFQAARHASTAFLEAPASKTKVSTNTKTPKKQPPKPKDLHVPSDWRNPLFKDSTGANIPYDDNWEFSPEDGTRAELFLPVIDDFQFWLSERKQRWKRKYKVYKHASEQREEDALEVDSVSVSHDFWTLQGFDSFEEWVTTRVAQWKMSYAWNKKKRQRIQKACEAVVHVSQNPPEFHRWLRIRRNQWRLLRRKRQRQRCEQDASHGDTNEIVPSCQRGRSDAKDPVKEEKDNGESIAKKRKILPSPGFTDIAAIDVILEQEDQELKRRRMERRELVDISFIFDASLGAPDDVVVHCFSFLEPREYRKLLCISKAYATLLKSRQEVWRQLCPSHWILPRRPRKPWHELFFHKLREEQRNSQKLWDDLLVKCSNVLVKGDHLQKIEKLVTQGEKDFGFKVNYVSGVVCERNSILNLAVIHQRHKVVRWLVDQKSADIESGDRGHFTALLNAAWAGDRQLVRFLMQRGADRKKVGYGHYSQALAHPDFQGLTAEGWARNRGHDDIAELIRLGL